MTMTRLHRLVLILMLSQLSQFLVDGGRTSNCPHDGPSGGELYFGDLLPRLVPACDDAYLEIYCCTRGYSDISWQKYDPADKQWEPVQLNSKVYTEDEQQTLVSTRIYMRYDNTSYRCLPTNMSHTIQHDTQVYVRDCSNYEGDPEFVIPREEDYRLQKSPGLDASITCEVFLGPGYEDKNPPYSLSWEFRNGSSVERWFTQLLPTSHRINITWRGDEYCMKSTVYINPVSSEDYGNYTCVVKGMVPYTRQVLFTDVEECIDCVIVDGSGALVAIAFMTSIVFISLLGVIYWRKKTEIHLRYKDRFKRPPPTNENKLYDALVVHSERCDADRQFCIEKMIPALETEHQYRLYLMERDAQLGAYHIVNYDNAIRSCQRLVFLLSPSLLQDQFCEYVFAQVVSQDYRNMIFIDYETIPDADWPEHSGHMQSAFKVAKHVIRWPREHKKKAKKKLEKQRERFWVELRYALPAKLENLPNPPPRARYGIASDQAFPAVDHSEGNVSFISESSQSSQGSTTQLTEMQPLFKTTTPMSPVPILAV